VNVIWQPTLPADAQRWQTLADDLGSSHCAPLAAELDREQRYPWETIAKLVEHKFTGLFLPKQWGGEGASLTATVAALSLAANSACSVGPSEAISCARCASGALVAAG